VLLSLLANIREVGYYAAPVQILATFGFVPMIVTSVIFPALSRDFHANFDQMRRLTRASLGGVISLGLPIAVGAVLVGPRAIEGIFGPAYRPSGAVVVVLALTVVPSFIGTFAFWALAAADKQRLWAYVMGTAAVVNPLINLLTIPYFQARGGHGSIGAAVAVLITDAAVCAAGLALMPRDSLRPFGPLVRMVLRAALATTLMAVPVWFLHNRFWPLQVMVGAVVFGASALALGVFKGDVYDEVRAVISAKLRRRLRRRPEADVPA
jgi:O-antigen/teichoic acid export membrane protein